MRFWKSGLVGAVAGCLLACSPGGGPNQSRGSGSLALSTDDKYLYAADTDNGIVAVIDPEQKLVLERIAVGKSPTKIAVGPDDTVYVTNRGDRSLSVIRKGEWTEAARVPTAVEPNGLAVAPDGRTVYVVNGASLENPQYGTLLAIDASSLQPKWEVPVGPEPRGLAIVSGNRAVVSLYKEGTLVEVDLAAGKVLADQISVYEKANATKLSDPNGTGGNFGTPFSSFRARGLSTLTATPTGDRVFAPGVWAREDRIDRRPSTAGGYYSSGGPCNLGSVASPALITADTSGGGVEPKVDDLTSCFNNGSNTVQKDYPPSVTAPKTSDGSALVLQGPAAAAVDPTGSFLFVVNREGQSVAVLPVYTRTGENVDFSSNGSSVQSMVSIGKGADGIALTNDGKRAFVYNQFDHRLDILEQGVDPNDSRARVVVNAGSIPVAEDTLSPDLAMGRKMFFDARDERLSAKLTRVACSSCHLDGRDDGHVWNFPDGPRQTPTLAGRNTMATGPWHWSGEFTSLDDFYNHTIRERMGGSGLTATATNQLKQWLDAVPGPDNALKLPEPTDQHLRGAQAFAKAGCASCHASENLVSAQSANVGTLVTGGKNPDTGIVVTKGFNVPSLRSVARTAPYMHDGSVKTIDERVYNNPNDAHGATSSLTDDEKADLVAWLKTL